ncbi:hypothetical protein T06_4304 [Trichinella sp. T6]|nr:hypothetical protein T06_4304 [Trichinella sp. T6]
MVASTILQVPLLLKSPFLTCVLTKTLELPR